jgi:hypothetical protein
MPAVAVAGDIVATAGSDTTFGGTADTGAWSAGQVTVVDYAKLTIGGQHPVVHEASCTFTFNGSKTAGGATTAVTGSSTVTLRASTTVLQKALSNVLLVGDEARDSFGNSVSVGSAAAKLHSGR